jgi:hypothetical protein
MNMKRLYSLLFLIGCLVISADLFAGIVCKNSMPDLDTAINNDETAHHFNIGGHLFAGTYPINNPESTGDTGIVYLYRVINNYVIPVDTVKVTTFGYYIFTQIIEGEYILKAGLTINSARYKDFFPSYYSNVLKWNSCDHLALIDSNRFEANIHLLSTIDSLTGPASMTGFVMQTLKDAGSQKMSNAEILLFNGNMSPLIFSFSDQNGDFSFDNLPFGTYYLMVESTGKFPALLRVILDENHPVFDSLMLEVLSHAPTSIQEINSPSRIESIPVFPNPAMNNLNLVLRSGEPQTVVFEIFTFSGQKIFTGKCQVNGYKSLSIPLDRYSKGTYYLILRSEDGKWSQNQKFVKY